MIYLYCTGNLWKDLIWTQWATVDLSSFSFKTDFWQAPAMLLVSTNNFIIRKEMASLTTQVLWH